MCHHIPDHVRYYYHYYYFDVLLLLLPIIDIIVIIIISGVPHGGALSFLCPAAIGLCFVPFSRQRSDQGSGGAGLF